MDNRRGGILEGIETSSVKLSFTPSIAWHTSFFIFIFIFPLFSVTLAVTGFNPPKLVFHASHSFSLFTLL
jgi:hypothetical protein